MGNGGFGQSIAKCRVTSPQLKQRSRLPFGKGRFPARTIPSEPRTAVASQPLSLFLHQEIINIKKQENVMRNKTTKKIQKKIRKKRIVPISYLQFKSYTAVINVML